MRGSLQCPALPSSLNGSIPACAGQTRPASGLRGGRTVYPRVCGADQHPYSSVEPPFGLSPRVRGRRIYPRLAILLARSIPACAGRHLAMRGRKNDDRSIPACAGQTRKDARTRTLLQVYPRVCGADRPTNAYEMIFEGLSPVCGAAWMEPRSAPYLNGLSPRVRGSPN